MRVSPDRLAKNRRCRELSGNRLPTRVGWTGLCIAQNGSPLDLHLVPARGLPPVSNGQELAVKQAVLLTQIGLPTAISPLVGNCTVMSPDCAPWITQTSGMAYPKVTSGTFRFETDGTLPANTQVKSGQYPKIAIQESRENRCGTTLHGVWPY